MFRLLTALRLLTVIAVNSAVADPARVTIGVLADDGDQKTIEHWEPTADYLSEEIPERRFIIVPRHLEGMRRAAKYSEVDFILTNPGQYVDLQAQIWNHCPGRDTE